MTPEKNQSAVELGRLGGLAAGGWRRFTPERRREIAMLGVAARRKRREERAKEKAASARAAERRDWLLRFEADISPAEIARLNEAIRRRSQSKIAEVEATG